MWKRHADQLIMSQSHNSSHNSRAFKDAATFVPDGMSAVVSDSDAPASNIGITQPIKQLPQLEMPIIPETTSEEQHASEQESNCRYLIRRQAPPDRYSPTTYLVKRKENCNDRVFRTCENAPYSF